MEMSEKKTIKLKPYITLEEENKTKIKNRNEAIIKQQAMNKNIKNRNIIVL